MNSIEEFYLRILRGSITVVASISLITAVTALSVAGYKWQQADPDLPWESSSEEIATKFEAENLIKSLIEDDKPLLNSFMAALELKKDGELVYSDEALDFDDVEGFDKASAYQTFVTIAFGIGELSESFKLGNVLFGEESQEVTWSQSLSTKDDDYSNLNNLWHGLISYYLKDSVRIAPAIAAMPEEQRKALKNKLFGYVRRDTNTPIYFAAANDEFASVVEEYGNQYQADLLAAEVTRLEAMPMLAIAGGAFGAFLVMMFIFLAVAIESNLRAINHTLENQPK